jgi:hypothetical protein
MNFNFLNDIKLSEVVVKKTTTPVSRKINRTPEGISLRIYKNGTVYPSIALVEQFNLEYNIKNLVDINEGGNALDIINSNDWSQYPKEAQPVLFIGVTAKSEPKVDLFGTTRYNEDGTPKSSVLTQGTKSMELLGAVINLFGDSTTIESAFGEDDYLDLDVIVDNTLPVEIAYIPKTVARGPEKGQIKTERRDNITLYPVIVRNNIVEEIVIEANETQEINS